MLIIKIEGKENTIEKAIKKLKRKFDSTGTVKQLRKRKEFIKPSEERREEVRKAERRDKWNREHES